MVAEFPSAIFGKPPGADAYQIISQHPDFELPEIAGAFRRICNSFEWKPTNNGLQHRPCYGILHTGDATVVAKFCDTGRDTAGRPHTLRIECLLASSDQLDLAWNQLTQAGTAPPPHDDVDELVIIGDPMTFWSATGA